VKAFVANKDLDEHASAVQKAIVDVRTVCEELLSKNVDTIKTTLNEVKQQSSDMKLQNLGLKQQNNDLKQQIEALQCRVDGRFQVRLHQWFSKSKNVLTFDLTLKELQRGHDVDSLERICRLLGLALSNDIFSRKDHIAELDRHEKRIADEFRPRNWLSPKSHPERLEAVENDAEYCKWLECPDSGLLILAGNNHFRGAVHCWISPIAHRLIKKKTKAEKEDGISVNPDTCIFYLLGLREVDDTCLGVVSMLILRLLSLNKKVLRKEDCFTELCAELGSYVPPSDVVEDRAREMQNVLMRVAVKALDMLDEGTTVWIILDRVDKCQPAPSRTARSHHRRDGLALLRSMMYLVEHSKTPVKILTVVNRSDWPVEDEVDNLEHTREGSLILRRFDQ
jgi:FtsZ-binding cell division protein ZapB